MNAELVPLISRMFIARRDVKARQIPNGEYIVDANYTHGPEYGTRYPWTRADLEAHLEGTKTYGHYLLNADNECKLFAFDIDLDKSGKWLEVETDTLHDFSPREAWLDRSHPARTWMKYQMRMTAGRLARSIKENLDLPVAVAYTGAKGLHVYGFTGQIPAIEVREAALLALDLAGNFKTVKGKNFYKEDNEDGSLLTIEVFPKQDTISDKDLGNLMRAPLGRNLKSKDPTFFIDLAAPMGELKPLDPVVALSTGNPWVGQA